MKRWLTSCIDTITGLEIVLSEAGFNEACFFLEQNIKQLGKYRGMDYVGGNVSRLRFEKRLFLYDDNRMLLLGE